MNIASIDRGAYTPVEVSVRGKTVMIENTNNLITFNKSGVEEIIQVLQQALIKLPEEPEYVVVLPQNMTNTFWKYFFLNRGGAISNSNFHEDVLNEGSMTLDEIKAISEHYEPFAIPAEEFKQNEIGEF